MPVFHSLVSLDFDSVNDFVAIGNVSELDFERTDAFTLGAWIRATTDIDELTIYGKQDHTGVNPGYRLSLDTSGNLFFELVNSSVASNRVRVRTSGVDYKDGTWHHMCVTYGGTSTAAGVNLYVDSGLMTPTVVEDTLGANSILTSAGVSLGSRNSGSTELLFRGRMDEVVVYDKELSAGEVTTIFNDGHPQDLGSVGPTGNVVGYWYMGDGDSFPTIIDHSGSGNNGTMTGMNGADLVVDAPSRPEHHPLDYGSYTLEVLGPGIQPVAEHNAIVYGSYILEVTGPGIRPVAGHNAIAYGGFPDYLAASDLTRYYKMRALADPGPGYTTWIATSVPDFAGNQAPVAVQVGTIAIASKWTTNETIQQRALPTVEIIETFAVPGTATNPGVGLTLALVQTNAGTWSDQDIILLPASPSLGAEVIVKDRDGNGALKRVTIGGNGALIDGLSSRVMTTAWEALHVTYSGSAWSIV